MKNKIVAALTGILTIVALALCVAFSTVDDTGPTFSDWTRTNRWSFPTNNIGAPPVITIGGTNVTGLTTNLAFLHQNGTGGTNTLVVVNGIIVNIN